MHVLDRLAHAPEPVILAVFAVVLATALGLAMLGRYLSRA